MSKLIQHCYATLLRVWRGRLTLAVSISFNCFVSTVLTALQTRWSGCTKCTRSCTMCTDKRLTPYHSGSSPRAQTVHIVPICTKTRRGDVSHKSGAKHLHFAFVLAM